MTGTLIYTGRRNIRLNRNGKSTVIHSNEVIELPLYECVTLLAHDNRYKPANNETQQKLADMRLGDNKNEEINGILTGRRCFIIGRGASAKNVDLDSLNEYGYVIAVNGAFRSCKPDAIVFTDKETVKRFGSSLKRFRGKIICSGASGYDDTDLRENVFVFHKNRNFPTTDIRSGIYGKMSGQAALNIALVMNAMAIYLIGYDMDPGSQQTYFDPDEFCDVNKNYHDKKWLGLRLNEFRKFEEWRHKIFNVNPDTYIDIFDYKSIKDAIK